MRPLIIIFLLITAQFFVIADEQNNPSADRLKEISYIDEGFVPDEEVKPSEVSFNLGGTISFSSRIKFKDFEILPTGGFRPIPNEFWYGDARIKLWADISLLNGSYLHIGGTALLKAQDLNNEVNLIPLFNLDSLYGHIVYPLGSVVVGRSIYRMNSSLVFSGPLDGIELNIVVPYLNFKTFTGFTGLLGLLHPWFNPYLVSSADRSFVEVSNILTSGISFKINAPQSRRIFFAIDADINFYSQHINPYFLLQYDLQSIFQSMNTEYDINTFHLGLNLEGKIIQNLSYKVHLSGVFGTNPTSSGTVGAIVACAFETYLRYTIPHSFNTTLQIGYAIGTGNEEGIGEWSSDSEDADKGFWSDKYDGAQNNKYFYFGRFDGGYVLNPVLSNIHSLSFRFSINPLKNSTTNISFYAAFYQTFKVFNTGSISDDEATVDEYPVASEIDTGLLVSTHFFTLSLDAGIMIPLTAYRADDRNPRTRLGAVIAFTF